MQSNVNAFLTYDVAINRSVVENTRFLHFCMSVVLKIFQTWKYKSKLLTKKVVTDCT